MMCYTLESRGSIPGKSKIFLLSTWSREALELTQFSIQWVLGAVTPGVKQPGCERYSPPSSVEVKNSQMVHELPSVVKALFIDLRYGFTLTLGVDVGSGVNIPEIYAPCIYTAVRL